MWDPGETMKDLIFILVTIAFFVFSIAYVRFCERVK
jgi:cbb3-type cytochrome oxidase subunit 3